MTTRTLDRRNRSTQLIPLAGLAAGAALVAVVALAALGGGRGDGNGHGGGGAPPATASPSVTPAPTPVAPPDPTPVVTTVDLENVTGADVYVDIADRTGLLVGARSGKPVEGQSVAPYTLEVENLDATTLKLKWVDYPIDNALALYIDESDGGIRLLLVQPEPTGPTDSIALDRELILSFSQPISADQVEAFLQDGLDTPG